MIWIHSHCAHELCPVSSSTPKVRRAIHLQARRPLTCGSACPSTEENSVHVRKRRKCSQLEEVASERRGLCMPSLCARHADRLVFGPGHAEGLQALGLARSTWSAVDSLRHTGFRVSCQQDSHDEAKSGQSAEAPRNSKAAPCLLRDHCEQLPEGKAGCVVSGIGQRNLRRP